MPNDTTPAPAGDVRELIARLRGLGIRDGENSDDAWGLVFSWYDAKTTKDAAKAAIALSAFFEEAAAALERLAERVVRLEAALETAADEMASCETLASEPDAASLIRSWARRARAALQPQQQGGGDE